MVGGGWKQGSLRWRAFIAMLAFPSFISLVSILYNPELLGGFLTLRIASLCFLLSFVPLILIFPLWEWKAPQRPSVVLLFAIGMNALAMFMAPFIWVVYGENYESIKLWMHPYTSRVDKVQKIIEKRNWYELAEFKEVPVFNANQTIEGLLLSFKVKSRKPRRVLITVWLKKAHSCKMEVFDHLVFPAKTRDLPLAKEQFADVVAYARRTDIEVSNFGLLDRCHFLAEIEIIPSDPYRPGSKSAHSGREAVGFTGKAGLLPTCCGGHGGPLYRDPSLKTKTYSLADFGGPR